MHRKADKWYFLIHWNPLTLVFGIPLLAIIVLYAIPGGSHGSLTGFNLVETLPKDTKHPALQVFLPARYAGDYDRSGPRRFLAAVAFNDFLSKSKDNKGDFQAGQGAPDLVRSHLEHSFKHMRALMPAEQVSDVLWAQSFQEEEGGSYWVAAYDCRNNTLMAIRPQQ